MGSLQLAVAERYVGYRKLFIELNRSQFDQFREPSSLSYQALRIVTSGLALIDSAGTEAITLRKNQ